MLRLAGKTIGECSVELNLPPRTLFDLRDRYDLDAMVESLHADMLDSILRERGEVAQLAIRRLKDLLKSDKPRDWRWAIDRVISATPEGGGEMSSAARKTGANGKRLLTREELIARAAQGAKRLGKGR